MRRRDILFGASASALTATAFRSGGTRALADTWSGPAPADPRRTAAYYIPGYRVEMAYHEGRPVKQHPAFQRKLPKGYDGILTLLTRLDEEDGSVRRALLPIRGHGIAVSADRRVGVFNSHNGRTMLTFDPATLELGTFLRFEDGIRGGGHSVFLPDGRHMAVTERQAYRPYSGRPEDHYGRIAIRDNRTLALIDSFDCHAIAPHEVNLLSDGRHIAVSSYGSTRWPKGQRGPHRYIVEPAITIHELSSGKLVHRFVPDAPASEFRHIAAFNLQRIFVLQNAKVPFEEVHALMRGRRGVYLPDLEGEDGMGDLPLPVLRADFSDGVSVSDLSVRKPRRMVRAQSITYDPVHDEALATFTTSHSLVVFAGADGAVKRLIDTTVFGLRMPRGIALHPNGTHYAVTGGWHDLFVFERGTHRLVRERCLYETFFEHSHIAAA